MDNWRKIFKVASIEVGDIVKIINDKGGFSFSNYEVKEIIGDVFIITPDTSLDTKKFKMDYEIKDKRVKLDKLLKVN